MSPTRAGLRSGVWSTNGARHDQIWELANPGGGATRDIRRMGGGAQARHARNRATNFVHPGGEPYRFGYDPQHQNLSPAWLRRVAQVLPGRLFPAQHLVEP